MAKATKVVETGSVQTDEAKPDPSIIHGAKEVASGVAEIAEATQEDVLGLITDAEHAYGFLKGKVAELHTLAHNAASAASVPVHAAESLIAEVQYILGIIRSKQK